METLDKDKILDVLKRCPHWEKDYNKREVDILISDGYADPFNRTILFCVKGSPNRFYGYIEPWVRPIWVAKTNQGRFYYSEAEDKVSKGRASLGV